MTWPKSFRDAFCEHYKCSSDDFERLVFRRGLHRRALPLTALIYALNRSYFEKEKGTIGYLGNARSEPEFRTEVATYRSYYRRRGGFLRKVLCVRLSGKRLMDLLGEVSPGLKP